MPICKGPCKDIVVNVAAAEGSIYIMYREYMSKVGDDYKMMPITVNIISKSYINLQPILFFLFNLTHPQTNCNMTNSSNYMCNDSMCTISTEDGPGSRKSQNLRDGEETFFLYVCGDYNRGILQVTEGNVGGIREFCASLYNCSDPEKCWMEDIMTGGVGVSGVMAVSIMPGCKMKGETTLFSWRRVLKPSICTQAR